MTNVTIQEQQTIYVYDVSTLWMAYGLAISISMLAVMAGWIAMYLNGSSYSDNVSTFIRVGRNASMSVDVQPEDHSGRDPLPKYLEQARIDIGSVLGESQVEKNVLSQARPAPEIERLVGDSDSASNWASELHDAVSQSGSVVREVGSNSRG